MGPVALWPLDETAGTAGADVTGNGHGGTYTATYTLNRGAIPPSGEGNSVLFETLTVFGRLAVPDHAALRLTTQGTLIAWVKGSTPLNSNTIISKTNCSNAGYALLFHDGFAELGIWNAGGVVALLGSPVSPFSGSHLVAGRWSGATADVWVDGAVKGTSGAWSAAAAGTAGLEVGAISSCAASANHELAFAAVFNTRLSNDDLAAILRAGQ